MFDSSNTHKLNMKIYSQKYSIDNNSNKNLENKEDILMYKPMMLC